MDSLTLSFTLVDEATHSMYTVDYWAPYQKWFGGWLKSQRLTLTEFVYDPPKPHLLWQRHTAGSWSTFFTGSPELYGVHTAAVGAGNAPLSDPGTIAGVAGHFVRLFLSGGDFGWEDYMARVAGFAEAVANGDAVGAGTLIAPTPPTISSVVIGYRTAPVTVTDLRTRNGHATWRFTLPAQVLRPFKQPLDTSGGAVGTVAFGFTVPRPSPGSGFSWYVRLSQAPSCASAGRAHDAVWEYWTTDAAWRRLPVLDGTAGLRQSGLIRFVMPRDWDEGCPDESADTGRWVRLRTTTPGFVGELVVVRVDAVTARYRSDLPAAALDSTPLTPWPRASSKGCALRRPASR